MTAAALTTAMAAGLLMSGCGAASADLFEVSRTGEDANANVLLVVSDAGTVRCNNRAERPLGGQRVLTARQLARDLEKQAALDIVLEPGKGSTLRYRVRMESGSVAFSDTSAGRPGSFDRLVAFTADVTENVCRIER